MANDASVRRAGSAVDAAVRWLRLLVFVAVVPMGACAAAGEPLEVWATSAYDEHVRLVRQTSVTWTNDRSGVQATVVVDSKRIYQTMDGFGASMTEASAELIRKTDEKTQNRILESLFDRERGIGISILRQPIGACDFNTSFFTYADVPGDETLEKFSIERDERTTIPYLLRARAINPELRLFASPWSPPAWMKSGRSLLGGSGGTLLPRYYRTYAEYFALYLSKYRALGLPIELVTIQNEPLYAPSGYPGMVWKANEQIDFIADHLGPALKRAGLATKIAVYDHNWDNVQEARTLLSSARSGPWIAGSAWHSYGGSAEAMSTIHGEFPDKDVWFTEGGSGSWIGDGSFRSTFRDGMRQSIRIVRNWSKTVLWWNLVLNPAGGPNAIGNPEDAYNPSNRANYGLLTVDERSATLLEEKRAGYYTLGHWSKFVRPGAVRIESSNREGELETAAFRNPDGSFVLVAYNPTMNDTKFALSFEGRTAICPIAGESATTIVWRLPDANAGSVGGRGVR